MSRSSGPAGMLDIRTAAIYQDLIYAKNPCAPGTTKFKQQRYYKSDFFKDLPQDSDAKNPKKFDRPKDWIHCAAAAFICMNVLGILHSLPLLLRQSRTIYKLGNVEFKVIAIFTYSITFFFSQFAACLVRCMGHRLTCIFGLLLFFVGLILDAIQLPAIFFYVARLLLLGFGACFAITAASSSVVRHFRNNLRNALVLVTIASPLGTIIFHGFLYGFAIEAIFTYSWTLFVLSFLIMACIALTHVLPSSVRPARHPNPFLVKKTSTIVKECLHDLASCQHENFDCKNFDTNNYASLENNEDEKRNCLCVCVIDVTALTDLSFLLWAIISSCALMTMYIPYLFMIWYAVNDFGINVKDGLWFIIGYSITSLVTRVGITFAANFTFMFNRTLFQVATAGTGIMYLILSEATTWGWLMVWCMCTGALEGLIVSVIPNLTTLTIPRRYLACCWAYIVAFHGIAVAVGPVLMCCVGFYQGGDYRLAWTTIGLFQITAAILALFIPNEEFFEEQEEKALAQAQAGREFPELAATAGGYRFYNSSSNGADF